MNVPNLVSTSLFFFGVYHTFVGLPSVLSFSLLSRVGFLLYRLKIPTTADPQFEYVIKPLGLFALSTAGICFFAVFRWDLSVQQDILKVFSLLLFGRGLCRLYYSPLFLRAFGTTPARNKGNAILTFVLGTLFAGLSFLTP